MSVASPPSVSSNASSAPLTAVQHDNGDVSDDILCVRCNEHTTFQSSQRYGRNPFSRVCNQCSSSYRCRMALIKKEKMADPNNQSSTEQVWNKYTKAEQTAWYVKQKRSSNDAGKCREIAASVAEIAETRSTARGYRRTHRLLPFSQYHSEQKLKGFAEKDIEDQWKSMLMNPGVERETHLIDGAEETCVVVFGGIEKYVDENEGVTTSVKRATEENTRSDLAAKRQRFVEVHAERSSAFMADAVATAACVPDAELLNIEVSKSLLPNVPVTNALGSGAASLFMADLDRDLACTEDAIIEAGQQWEKDAEKFKRQISRRDAQKKKKLDASLEKDLITGRAALDRQVAAIVSKWKGLEADHQAFVKALSGMTGQVYDAMKSEVVAKVTAACAFKDKVLKTIAEAKATLEGEGASRETLAAARKAGNSESVSFVAELGAFKVAKYAMTAHQKTIDQEAKRQAKVLKHTSAIATKSAWTPGTHLGEALHKGMLKESYATELDLDAPAAVVCVGETIDGLSERLRVSSHYSTQVRFLAKHMDQSHSRVQRVSLAHKATVRDIETVLCEDIFPPVAWEAPQDYEKVGKGSWSNAFGIQLARYNEYEFFGITSLSVGEVFFVLDGDFSLCGLRIGKLKGSLKEQLEKFSQFSDDVKASLAFSYRTVVGKENRASPIIVIPPGSLIAITSASAVVVTWSFGAHIPTQVDLARDVMGQLLENWPAAGQNKVYKGWWSWLQVT